MFVFFNTFFFTLLAYCAFISFGQWRITKDRSIPWYIGYLAATFLHYGRQFWIDVSAWPGVPSMPDMPLSWDTPLSYGAFACYALFVREVLEVYRSAPVLSRIMVVFVWTLGGLATLNLLLQVIFNYAIADKAHQVAQVVLFPLLVGLVALSLKKAKRFYELLILAGTSALVVGFLCAVALRRWPGAYVLLPDVLYRFPTHWGDFFLYHLKVGVALDVLCFSWAITLRQRILLQTILLPTADNSPPQIEVKVGVEPGIIPQEQINHLDIPLPEIQATPDSYLPDVRAFSTRIPISDDLPERLDVYLANNYGDEDLTISQIARDLCISTTQLNRRLKRATGRTTEQYLLHFRLEQARHKLLTEKKSVSLVSGETGFKDLAHFSRAFKKRYGMSPSEVLKRKG